MMQFIKISTFSRNYNNKTYYKNGSDFLELLRQDIQLVLVVDKDFRRV